MSARTAVVVGNPKPGSRTLAAATTVVRGLTDTEPDLVVDLATLGAALLDWQDPAVAALVDEVGAADLVVVASPTYKATYTGLLKLFLDRFAGGVGLRGVAVHLPATVRPSTRTVGASVVPRISRSDAGTRRRNMSAKTVIRIQNQITHAKKMIIVQRTSRNG